MGGQDWWHFQGPAQQYTTWNSQGVSGPDPSSGFSHRDLTFEDLFANSKADEDMILALSRRMDAMEESRKERSAIHLQIIEILDHLITDPIARQFLAMLKSSVAADIK